MNKIKYYKVENGNLIKMEETIQEPIIYHYELLDNKKIKVPNKDIGRGYFQSNNLSKSFPEFFEYITKKYSMEPKHMGRIYMFYNKLEEPPRCPICGKYTKFIDIFRGYSKYCSNACSNKSDEVNKLKGRHKPKVLTSLDQYFDETLGLYIPTYPQHHNALREVSIKQNYPEFHDYITNKYKNIDKWMEKLYLYYNNMEEPPKCPLCGKPRTFEDIFKGYNQYCSKRCSNSVSHVDKKDLNILIKEHGDITDINEVDRIPNISTSSAQVLRANYMSIHWPKFYIYLNNKYSHTKTWMEKVYLFHHNMEEPPRCPVCDKVLPFNNLNSGYNEYCSNACAGIALGSERIQRCIDGYKRKTGYDHPMKDPKMREHIKQQYLEKYGVENPMQCQEIKEKYIESRKKQFMDDFPEVLNIDKNWICTCACQKPECKHMCETKTFQITSDNLRWRKRYGAEICTILNPIDSHVSTQELKIREFLDSLGVRHIDNDRNIIKGLELDIYIPDLKIGIEYNGCYWHSLLNKEPKYHMNKWRACYNAGIELISIWESWDVGIVYKFLKDKLKGLDISIYKNLIFPNLVEWPLDLGYPNFKIDIQNIKEHYCIYNGYECYDSGLL